MKVLIQKQVTQSSTIEAEFPFYYHVDHMPDYGGREDYSCITYNPDNGSFMVTTLSYAQDADGDTEWSVNREYFADISYYSKYLTEKDYASNVMAFEDAKSRFNKFLNS